jgi:hypothetical protein
MQEYLLNQCCNIIQLDTDNISKGKLNKTKPMLNLTKEFMAQRGQKAEPN